MINLLYNPDQCTIQNCMFYDSTLSQFHTECVPSNVLILRWRFCAPFTNSLAEVKWEGCCVFPFC
jgi:hypothetical protein